MSERHRRPAIGRIAPGLEDDRDGRRLAFNDRRLKYLLAKLRDLKLTLAALGVVAARSGRRECSGSSCWC
jgi:hypothetical protein